MVISWDEVKSFVEAKNANPHDLLGIHEAHYLNKKGVVIRAFLSHTQSCSVVDKNTRKVYSLTKIDPNGFFEIFLPGRKYFDYFFRITTDSGVVLDQEDPYRFLPTISEFDCYLFNQGKHYEIYKKLGSHVIEHYGIKGTQFCVWAPNAKRVSVVGDFNDWDGRYFPMRKIGNSGIWELFIPKNLTNEKYKYEIVGADDNIRLKSDPYAQYFEPPMDNASIVFHENYHWADQAWTHKNRDFRSEAISIYEVHIDSWKRVVEENRPYTYRELAKDLCQYCLEHHFTHVEFLPMTEHPFLGSWGYQVTGYFASTQRYGTPDDFRYLVDYFHQNGIGVIIDWVPAHFPKDAFSLEYFDGTHLYEHADPRQGIHNDWGTLIFNYGRHEVRNFLIASALFWLKEFHIDGIRIDAVASMLYLDYSRKQGEWIPNRYGGHENIEAIEFLRELNKIIHERHPNAMVIAEESTSFGGVTRPVEFCGLGFDMKWNMGWMHDILSYFSQPTVYRKYHHNQLTFGMLYQNSERFLLALSHDEVVHGKSSLINKMPGSSMSEKAKNLRALYGLMWGWPGKKLLFMGDEFGQSNEWNYTQSLDWHLLQYRDHSGIQLWVKDLNKLYQEYDFLAKTDYDPNGFEWMVVDDVNNSVVAFVRKNADGERILVVCNLTPVVRENYRIGVDKAGFWKEILNSDATIYGGDGIGNSGGKFSENISSHGKLYSLSLTLPGLSSQFFYLKESFKTSY